MSDPINKPAHYTHGAIEPIDAIESWKLGFHLANVVKYVARAAHKGSLLNDLRKARWYLDREIGRLEKAAAEKPEPPTSYPINYGDLRNREAPRAASIDPHAVDVVVSAADADIIADLFERRPGPTTAMLDEFAGSNLVAEGMPLRGEVDTYRQHQSAVADAFRKWGDENPMKAFKPISVSTATDYGAVFVDGEGEG
jgi:hypothetical protein